MFTFSQMIDEMVLETRRPDLIPDMQRYLNQTIRECHFEPSRNNALFFAENFREAIVRATSESAFVWRQPQPYNFQKLQVVKYLGAWSDGEQVYPQPTTPGRHTRNMEYFYYQVGDSFVFSGYGGQNSEIALGWYEFPSSLVYEKPNCRPASYDAEFGWTYQKPWDESDCLKEQAQTLCTNWMIMRWRDILAEGLRAKVYKRLSDETRQRVAYSLYMQLRQGLWTSETAVLDY